MDDFSEYPQSVTEAKADKSGKGADWTPRDVLVRILREIDDGTINPDTLMVIYRVDDLTSYKISEKDKSFLLSIGMLERAKFMMQMP